MIILRMCVTAPVAGRANAACNDVDMPCTVPQSACVDGICVCNDNQPPNHDFTCRKFSHQAYLRLCITDALCLCLVSQDPRYQAFPYLLKKEEECKLESCIFFDNFYFLFKFSGEV